MRLIITICFTLIVARVHSSHSQPTPCDAIILMPFQKAGGICRSEGALVLSKSCRAEQISWRAETIIIFSFFPPIRLLSMAMKQALRPPLRLNALQNSFFKLQCLSPSHPKYLLASPFKPAAAAVTRSNQTLLPTIYLPAIFQTLIC